MLWAAALEALQRLRWPIQATKEADLLDVWVTGSRVDHPKWTREPEQNSGAGLGAICRMWTWSPETRVKVPSLELTCTVCTV